MLKKTITYEDFNGETVSEDFFFHLSKAELVELEMSHDGGLSASLARIVAAKDAKSIIEEFKNIMLGAYGKRSDDGRRFIKNQALREEFESTEAYSTLFMELVTDTNAAIEFINGVIPAGMAEAAADIVQVENKAALEVVPESKKPASLVTRDEIAKMSPEELEILGTRLKSGEVIVREENS